MQELFWFFLGAFVYFLLDKFVSTLKKISYINDIKICAFKLIGFAYEQLVFTTTAKYLTLEQSNMDKEKIKLYKNIDTQAFEQWKRETAMGLKESVPPIYRGVLEVDNWEDIMKALDVHYKKTLNTQPKK
tara:strand:- start:3649 stop:4038 length:390 start_codon:yes stop_codon:yes gene_type:complete